VIGTRSGAWGPIGVVALVVLFVCVLAPAVAFAQQPNRRASIGADVYVLVESETLTAKQSFTAVLGGSSMTLEGGGVDVVRIWKGLFARVAVAHAGKTGSRVFVDSSLHVYSLNVPLTINMTPIEVGGGWRLPSFDRKGHVVPYVGGTALWLRYQESSSFAEASENTDANFRGGAVFAGIEGNAGALNLGVEGVYRTVPRVIGAGGVSAAFNETDLGGAAARVRVGVRF